MFEAEYNFEAEHNSVMIVYGESREVQYAQILFQLIGKISRYGASQPISEIEYQTSCATIDSIPKGKIIFFGNSKEAKVQSKAIDWRFERFGMKYGWLGNRCVIVANPNEISLKEQSAFWAYYNSRIEQFKSLAILSDKISYTETVDIEEIHGAIKFEKGDDSVTKVAKVATAVIGSPLFLIAYGLKGIIDGLTLFEKVDLWKRQYELLICEFLINDFERFMNNVSNKIAQDQMIVVYDAKDAEYAHLLHNLVQQYSEYDIAEYTEKMFVDNAKTLSSRNKLIFLGSTKAAKERSAAVKYKYSLYGMRYGWIGNHCFVNIESIKAKYRNDFINLYIIRTKNESNVGLFRGIAGDKSISNVKNISSLDEYQYNLLLREFVLNGLSEFMRG